MSTTIDEKVVEMRFDNSNFENNVKTSMSTLEKLKSALKFKGASEGLSNIQASANKVNFSGMTNGIETVNAKFSYLQATIQHQLNNIVDSTVNAGKRMISALTIDPVKSGLQEYETQINAVQTILANTKKEGTNVEIVNAALDELNAYADKTIYNFTEMTRNIGTFTAAGVDLNTSVNAIQGIANLAAVSGSTSQQASTAMYQLSQALAAGKVQLMDWNSVVNAGMGGQVFQDALIRTSELMGTGAKQAIKAYGSFRESLTKGEWLTTEVLTETLNQFAGAYDKADLMAQGFTESQAEEIVDMAKTAEEAATKVKTFTQLWDVMKEAAQSGWAQTWRIIIGDFEEAKALFTPLADFFTNIIGKMSDARNNLLEGALSNNPFSKLADKIEKVTGATEKMKEVTQDYADIVDKVIGGEFGNGQERFDKLAESGYNWAKVQNMVNEKLGNSYRYTEDLGAAQEDLHNTQQTTIEDLCKMSDAQLEQIGFTSDEVEAFRELQEQSEKTGIPIKDLIEDMDQLNGRTLLLNGFKNIGSSIVKIFRAIGLAWRDVFPAMTSEQLYNVIAGFHKLSTKLKMSDETAVQLRYTFQGLFSILHIITTITGGALKIGFTLLSKILEAFDLDILTVTGSIGHAIKVFHDWLFEGNILAQILGYLINQIPVLVANIKQGVENFKIWFELFKENPAVEKFTNLLKRVVNIFKILASMEIGSDSFYKWIDTLKSSLKALAKSIPDVFRALGKELVNALDVLTGGKITKLKEFLASCSESPQVAALAEALNRLGSGFKSVFSVIGSVAKSIWSKATEIGRNIIEGLQNGLGEGVGDVVDKIIEVATNLINTFCDMLGIHSPSTVAFEWGKNIIQGLVNGLMFAINLVIKAVSKIAGYISKGFSFIIEKIGDGLSKIDWGNFFDILIQGFKKLIPFIPVALAGLLVVKLVQFLNAIDKAVDWFGGIIDGFQEIEQQFAKVLKAYAFDTRMEGIKKFAEAVAILVGSIVVLTFLDKDKMYDALGVVLVLSLILAGLMFVMDKFASTSASIEKGKVQIDGMKSGLIGMAIAIGVLAFVSKQMSGMNYEEIGRGFVGLISVVGAMSAFLLALSLLSKFLKANFADISKVGGMMIKVGIAMGLMIYVVKMLRDLTIDDVWNGVQFAIAFGIFFTALIGIAKINGNDISKVGGMVLKVVVAMGLMIGVVRLLRTLNKNDIKPAIAFCGGFLVFLWALVKVTNIGKDGQIAKLGGLLLSVSVSLLLMIGVCKLAGKLSEDDINNGGAFALAFVGFLWLLKKVLVVKEGEVLKMAGTLIAVSIAIGIMAIIVSLLGQMDPTKLLNGTLAVGILGTMLAMMIAATQNAQSCVGNIIAMAIAIGVMSAVIALLSLIEPEKLFGPTLAISMLMGMFALIESQASKIQGSMGAIIAMDAAVAIMGGMLYLLSTLPAQQTLPAALALSGTMLAFAAALNIIGNMQELSNRSLITLGIMTLVVAALGGVLYLLSSVDPIQSLANVVILGLAVAGIAGLLYLMQGLQAPSAGAIVGLVLITAVVGALSYVLYQLRDVDAVNSLIIVAAISLFLAAMTGVLYLCAGLGAIAGQAIVGALILVAFIGILGLVTIGLASLAMDVLHGMPQLGSDLSAFMTNVQPFLNGIVNVPDGIAGKAGALTLAIAALTGAKIIEAIASVLGGLGSLGSELGSFMQGAKPFIEGVNSIPDDIADRIGKLATAILELTGTNILDSIASFLSGDSTLGDLGADLKKFGDGMGSFVTNSANIDSAVSSIKKLSDVKDAVADVDLGNLKSIGKDLKNFSNNVAELNIAMIDTSISAAKRLVALMNSMVGLDSSGVSNFKPKSIGKELKKYSDSVNEVDLGQITVSITAAKRLKTLVSSLVGLDSSGISNFKPKPIGKALEDYSKSVSDVSAGVISASISAANKLKNFISSLSGLDTSGVAGFKSAVSSLAKTDLGSVAGSLSKSTSKFTSVGSSLSTSIAKGFKSKSSVLTSSATNMISTALKAVTSKKAAFTSAGSMLATGLTSGIRSRSGSAASAAGSMASSGASRARSYWSSFYSAGSYLVSGFVSGISANTFRATAQAAAMANVAEQAARNALKINSPSKVFKKIGSSVPEGFALGIGMLGNMVKQSVVDMSDNAIASTSKAIAKVSDLMSTDIDSNPTIRPILDLADIESGVGTINSMFSDNLAIGTSANLGAITTMMNQRNQNGTNSDVISAINELGSKLGNARGNTYNVNGITYDDGTNIAEAVKILIQAARMERRI